MTLSCLGILLVIVLSSSYFYVRIPAVDPGSDMTAWSDPSLYAHESLAQDFNLLSNSDVWGEGVMSPAGGPLVDEEWTYLGTVVDEQAFALVWKSDVNQIIRVSIDEEIYTGVKVLDIDDNSIRYLQDGDEKMIQLFAPVESQQ